MPSGTSSNSQRRPWMASTIWGWRLEIALSAGTVIACFIAEQAGPLGPLAVAGIIAIALRCRPDIRKHLKRQIRQNREHRWLQAALWHCAIVGRNGTTPKVGALIRRMGLSPNSHGATIRANLDDRRPYENSREIV